MQKVTSTTPARPAIAISAARLAFASGAAVLLLLAALHIISPEFDPSWRMVSEYALGEHGWLVSFMFLAWALSCTSLFSSLQSQVQHRRGRIGLGFLLVAGVGMGMAAIFNVSHNLHGLATLLGIPSLPIAAVLISTSLVRNPAWASSRRLLLWTANLTWISLVAFFAVMFFGLSQNNGQFGPGVLIGWPNRLVFVTYCGWLMAAASAAIASPDGRAARTID